MTQQEIKEVNEQLYFEEVEKELEEERHQEETNARTYLKISFIWSSLKFSTKSSLCSSFKSFIQ